MKRIASAALLLVLASTLVAVAAQQQPAYTSIQGTVHALQPKSGSLDVVTGVGMALRLVHLSVPPTLASGGAAVSMSALKRGDIVRVQCHYSGKQLIADRIEKVGPR